MSLDPHYIWAFGHALLLACSTKVALSSVLFRGVSPLWYKASYSGALLSYAIVCFKSIGTPQLSIEFVQKALLDENVQYFLLSCYWWISKPVALSLLPFATFSLFHCLTFIRANIIPKFSPPAPPSAPGQPPRVLSAPEKVGRSIQLWVKGNYDSAMKFVAYTELVIFIRVLLGAVTFQNSVLAPILVAHFLRMRYHHSAFTRGAVDYVTGRADATIANQSPVIQKGWNTVKGLIKKWNGTIIARRDAAPAAGAAPVRAAR
ncbi:hypothetical protein BDY24DRAFT_401030 [Mrakia frigida]|uniref:uncharacterized protein n=1 Tax=Mrakia frigida TaxID=29902 RepID=UPI003FCC075A